jgi:hypothetical protein
MPLLPQRVGVSDRREREREARKLLDRVSNGRLVAQEARRLTKMHFEYRN